MINQNNFTLITKPYQQNPPCHQSKAPNPLTVESQSSTFSFNLSLVSGSFCSEFNPFFFQIQIFLFFSFIELRARYVKIDQSVKVEHSTKRVPALNIIDSCNEGHKINFAWHHM